MFPSSHFNRGWIYINASLPFNATSSCLIFEKVSYIIEYIVSTETGRNAISHYLDDFPLLRWSLSDAHMFLQQFVDIVTRLGFPIAREKMIGPAYIIEYLGMLLNFREQVLGIPENKRLKCLKRIQQLIDAHRERESVTVERNTEGHR